MGIEGLKSLSWLVMGAAVFLSPVTSSATDEYREAVLADKPFAYYRLGEASNRDRVADEMGRNPGGYINAPDVGVPGAIISDPHNSAVRLSRLQNQYIRLTPFGSYGARISSGFSVEYWLKTANFTVHQNILGTASKPNYITDFLDLRGDFSHSLEGSLDEVAFYTTPLSEEAVAKHYRAAGYRDHER